MKADTQLHMVTPVRPAQLRVSASAYALCIAQHKGGPVYPCPVCFLILVHGQSLVDFAHHLLTALAAEGARVGPVSEKFKEVLKEFNELEAKVLSHVIGGGGA